MNEAMIWFFLIGTTTAPFPPTRLGPMTESQCVRLQKAVPELPGRCQKAIGMYACEVPGRPGVGTSCPVFDDETIPRTGSSQ